MKALAQYQTTKHEELVNLLEGHFSKRFVWHTVLVDTVGQPVQFSTQYDVSLVQAYKASADVITMYKSHYREIHIEALAKALKYGYILTEEGQKIFLKIVDVETPSVPVEKQISHMTPYNFSIGMGGKVFDEH